ncbi:MAG: sigma-54 dependent transcriptional regulator [Myxococcota bacterium]
MSARILVVEDEPAIRVALRGLLAREGHEVELAESGEVALDRLAREDYDLVLTDLALGRGASGMDVLLAAKRDRPETAVVMITAHGSEKIAVEAMKSGADDYVPKPFDNDELRVIVARALDRHRLQRENRLLREQIAREFGYDRLIGSGPGMRRVFETVQKVAETDVSVLVRGESGTGKELVAQALHNASPRRGAPFVAVNCAAIHRELVESELFGHEKGAFTGADRRRIGRFEAAQGGTIFLDEIGDMAPETQAKVLRVLEERRLERVGSTDTIEVDVRIVSATHRDLKALVREGRFREDLYYRLAVVEIALPPLRERLEDLPALAERFLGGIAERLAREPGRLSAGALARLSRHDWPSRCASCATSSNARRCSPRGPRSARRTCGSSTAWRPRKRRFRTSTADLEAALRRGQAADHGGLRAAVPLRGAAQQGNVSRTASAIGWCARACSRRSGSSASRPRSSGFVAVRIEAWLRSPEAHRPGGAGAGRTKRGRGGRT